MIYSAGIYRTTKVFSPIITKYGIIYVDITAGTNCTAETSCFTTICKITSESTIIKIQVGASGITINRTTITGNSIITEKCTINKVNITAFTVYVYCPTIVRIRMIVREIQSNYIFCNLISVNCSPMTICMIAAK